MAKGDAVGAWLRGRREELGLSRQQIVTLLRGAVSYSHLTKLERGERRATADVLKILAPAYRTDIAHLLKLGGYLSQQTKTAEPEPVQPFDTWEGIEEAVRRNGDLSPEQKRGLIVVLKPIVTPLLDEAKRTKRRETREAG